MELPWLKDRIIRLIIPWAGSKYLNQGYIASGTPLQVSLENNALFNLQTKTLMGTHLDYKFSDNFTVGGTIMNLTERPLTQKVNMGDEPISNTIWGLNTKLPYRITAADHTG